MRYSAILGLLLPQQVYATCTSGLITINPSGVSFGNYSAAGDSTSMGNVAMSCSLGGSLPSFTIALNGGVQNSFQPRKMSPVLGTQKFNYNLYTTSSYTTVWGDGTNTTVTQTYTGGGSSKTFNIYGDVPQSQYVAGGVYSDTVTVTITY
jgi:spore coat protein U-like protein